MRSLGLSASLSASEIPLPCLLACVVKKVVLILCSSLGNVYFLLWLLSGFLKFIFDVEHDISWVW